MKFEVVLAKLDKDHEPYGAGPVYEKVEAASEEEVRRGVDEIERRVTKELLGKLGQSEPSFHHVSLQGIRPA